MIKAFEDSCYYKHALAKHSKPVTVNSYSTDFPQNSYERCLYKIVDGLSDGCGINVTPDDLFCIIEREVWLVVDYGGSPWHHEYALDKPVGFTI
ncbi:MAG: hypothetical protein IKF78_16235 [Atopobiaceae bacterium]|nr:hypothetical protein [Atopobiaceae bacterium]